MKNKLFEFDKIHVKYEDFLDCANRETWGWKFTINLFKRNFWFIIAYRINK